MNYRGKLDQTKVELNFVTAMGYRLPLYLISWLVKGLKCSLMAFCYLEKGGIYFCNYVNKVQVIVFNLVFVDLVWFVSRTLIHSSTVSLAHSNLA